MSDIRPTPPIKLDAVSRKRLDAAMSDIAGLKKQAAALKKLGVTMPTLDQQIEWSEKAYKTLIEDFT